MKKSFTTASAIIIWTAIFAAPGLLAQDKTFTKDIRKEFPVSQNTRLELSNMYGNVDIVNREESLLTIEVKVQVNTRDKEKADDILNKVHISIDQSGDVVRAVTDLDDDFGNILRGSNGNNGGLEINYTVTMPKTLPINLSHKYGGVYIDELTGTSTIDVKYGKLTINRFLHDSKEPLSKIYLSYSKGTIQDARWIELDIKYSQVNITDSKALAVLSKYSKVFVTSGSSIVSESKYDTYEVGKLNNLITNAAYGHFVINELSGKLQVETKYTDVLVDKISSGFELIKINSSYGTYKLGIDPAASYKINGYAKYCSITIPEINARVNQFNENNEMKVNGVVGTNQNPAAEVSVTSHYGNIRLIP